MHQAAPHLGWKHQHADVQQAATFTCVLRVYRQINEQRGGRFSSPANIPTICEALHKAALDPRVDGIYFKVGCPFAGCPSV